MPPSEVLLITSQIPLCMQPFKEKINLLQQFIMDNKKFTIGLLSESTFDQIL
jgi:hypothetical protein